MNYQDLIVSMERFGSTKRDICIHSIGIDPDQIHKNVIIAPWWEPPIFPGFGTFEYLSESDYSSIKVWNLTIECLKISYIKTGIGAPVLMDVLLALGVTPCRQIAFIGSVGSLDDKIGIGDIVIPAYSICGDGASRYISSDKLADGDAFGEKQYPDKMMYERLIKATSFRCEESGVKWHIGNNYSTDTVFAQFVHIDEIIGMGCNVIEMETAAAFKAAAFAGIPMAALFSVSDNTVANKSLVSGRTSEEMQYRKKVRRELFPRIIIDLFQSANF